MGINREKFHQGMEAVIEATSVDERVFAALAASQMEGRPTYRPTEQGYRR